MRQITDIRELRTLQLGILDHIHAFCIAHNTTYFLACGTLIGAVRHKGYIPWDDDIDLYMPRADYERFVKEYQRGDSPYELLEPRLTKDYVYTFGKVADTRTVMVETWYDNFSIGVNIDIFPLDYVADDPAKRNKRLKRIRQIQRIRINKKKRLLRDRKPWALLKCAVSKMLPISSMGLYRLLMKLSQSEGQTATVSDITEACPNIYASFPASAIRESIDIEFEGKMYRTMAGYDACLTNIYGDYMTLPPEEKRLVHSFEAYVKD